MRDEYAQTEQNIGFNVRAIRSGGFLVGSHDFTREGYREAVCLTIADAEGFIRQWMDEKISFLKEWDRIRNCSATAQNGTES